jgi:hypothetical protein
MAARRACRANRGIEPVLGQVGNWPPSFRSRLAQSRASRGVNLAYLFNSSLVGLRYETDQNSDARFACRSCQRRGYRRPALSLSSSFYTILGRGIVPFVRADRRDPRRPDRTRLALARRGRRAAEVGAGR